MNERPERLARHLRLIDEISRLVAAETGGDYGAGYVFDQAARRIQAAFGLCTLAVYVGQPLSLRLAYGGEPAQVGDPVPEGLALLALCGQPPPYGPVLHARERPATPSWVAGTARSELTIPLCSRGRRVGVLDLYSPEVDAFDELDVRTLVTLARQLTFLINQRTLRADAQSSEASSLEASASKASSSEAPSSEALSYARLQSRLQEATTLYQITRSVDYSADLQEVLEQVVKALRPTLKATGASIALIDAPGDEGGYEAIAGADPPVELREALQAKVVQSGKPMMIANVEKSFPAAGLAGRVHAMLMVPLVSSKGEIIGTLGVCSSRTGAFTRGDEHLLTVASGQIAVVVENMVLYADLEQRSRRLEHAYQRLQEFSELKDQILQNISHELRTPLTLIKGYVELIIEGQLGPVQPDQAQSLAIIARKADDVVRIIEQIVSLSPLDNLSLDYARFPVRALMENLLTVFRRHTADKPVSVSMMPVAPDLYVEGDFEKIRRACYNILDNAIKFSPDGGHVMMAATMEGAYVHLSFRDQGIGIPEGRLSQIFETFYQVDGSSTRRFGGLGLGLAVVNRVVNAHMGKVWAESELDRGSTFHVLLPQERPSSRVMAPNVGVGKAEAVP